jgi:hypothetical protein
MMERQDGNGFLEVLPAGDIVGSHGKTYLLAAFDELRGYRTSDIQEALPFDAARTDTPFSGCQKRARQWECTYRNLQVTGEERIKESNRDAAGCSTKNSFCCPRSYLVFSLPKLLIEYCSKGF